MKRTRAGGREIGRCGRSCEFVRLERIVPGEKIEVELPTSEMPRL